MVSQAPGLRSRHRRDGTKAFYWVATGVVRDPKDFPHKTVRVHGTHEEMAIRCQVLTSELRQWISGRQDTGKRIFDGTLSSLIRLYQHTPESSYHTIKHNSRVSYDTSLKIIESSVGARRLDKLTGLDFRRWHNQFKAPKVEGGPERLRRATSAMQILRVVIRFGVVANIPECFRLSEALHEMRFRAPKSRTQILTFEQVRRICEVAIANGRVSIALAQALQFELTLRQIDVIGRWEPAGDNLSGIVDRGSRWRDGLLWSHLDAKGILVKPTSKVDDVTAEHDTMGYPFLRQMLDMVPVEEKTGPIIIDERSGVPYRSRHFTGFWRDIATMAGVPKSIWNRDSRAGGITEGSDAGADLEHLRHHANHKSIQTTSRYNRGALQKSRSVAVRRVAYRTKSNQSLE